MFGHESHTVVPTTCVKKNIFKPVCVTMNRKTFYEIQQFYTDDLKTNSCTNRAYKLNCEYSKKDNRTLEKLDIKDLYNLNAVIQARGKYYHFVDTRCFITVCDTFFWLSYNCKLIHGAESPTEQKQRALGLLKTVDFMLDGRLDFDVFLHNFLKKYQ